MGINWTKKRKYTYPFLSAQIPRKEKIKPGGSECSEQGVAG